MTKNFGKKKLHISIKIGQYKMKKKSSKILCRGYYIGMGGDVGKWLNAKERGN
jgi:hypothetical protein